MPKKSTDSPALTHRTEEYPAQWGGIGKGRVPSKVFITKTKSTDEGTVEEGQLLGAWVESDGTVFAIGVGGERLIKLGRGEYYVMSWHGDPVSDVIEPLLRMARQHEQVVVLLDSLLATLLISENKSHININVQDYAEIIDRKFRKVMSQ